MPEKTKRRAVARKFEGDLESQKEGKEMIASEESGEVKGRNLYYVNIYCPTCGADRVVPLDFEGKWFTCGRCGRPYQVWDGEPR